MPKRRLKEVVKEKLRGLLCKHAAVFARDDKDFGLTNVVTHDIETGDAKPIRQPPKKHLVLCRKIWIMKSKECSTRESLSQGKVRRRHLWFWSKKRMAVCAFV